MKALIIVDMQNDFMPGGPLGVPEANKIIPIINALIPKFPLVVASQDWHPKNHKSFAINHLGKKTGDVISLNGIRQILWPAHCVQNTSGAELVEDLDKAPICHIIQKGTDQWIDSYSTFFDNARRKETGLEGYLRSKAVEEIYIVGVATDYCVLYSVLDALDLGFKVVVIQDCCRGINLHKDDEKKAFARMQEKGAKLVFSKDLL